eukprot:TRINITY_DN2361_c0_g1::TRINITY_DN2361_c0_g1_i1::g.20875::m.20875 TRINITY_DN2361_c0_g1::TRINITY_DN2361_c0_g1_i1::g.20875  ORF type:complete len:1035 (-),score=144.87,sp/P54678/ATC1_DICDI/46.38/0.0,E1-E2_ATPase/PF00122.15/1.1e-64,Cation_ATPase_C/PF00689.16/2.6e+03,Cation_ATPase_C/PF00689.16/3e+02,Cation_ATPase_C/PF00689.16/7.1e-43,Hydrolase/PF00702.21/4.4e+03,Hydrolase/PF00702.21/7.3e-27,Hydrolase_like2/PF13246.1/2.8e-18,Hydrolase_like2/PF13246.1/1.2e+04,HAD/PF12710.2/2.9e-14,Cation_ATPase_N/PF0069
MAPKKRNEYSDVDVEAAGEIRESPYQLTVEDLLELKSAGDVAKLEALGGIRGIAQKIGSDIENGLSKEEIECNFAQRRAIFNMNVYPEPDPASFIALFIDALKDPTLMILGGAALVALAAGIVEHPSIGWIEGTAILIAILIVGLVTAGNDYQKERQFRALNAEKNNRKVKVIRASKQEIISIYDINVGDIVQLDTGDQVPADGLFVNGYNMTVDESVMTGESDSVKKNDKKPFMLSGCQVDGGVGTMIVTAVGVNSEWGQTLAKLQQEPDETPLQQKLEALATRIGKLGLCIAIMVFIIRLSFWAHKLRTHEIDFSWAGEGGIFNSHGVLGFFIAAITIVVVAVPEGLPLAVTIALAYSMKKMMADNNLVRRLEACETMGNATNICSDKTGTLTQNRMTVVRGLFGGVFYPDVPLPTALHPTIKTLVTENAALNSSESSYITMSKDGRPDFIGSKTECALLMLTNKFDVDYHELRKQFKKRELYAFSSDRKRMSCMVYKQDGGFRLYTKGASEIVLGLCSTMIDENGDIVPLTDSHRNDFLNRITEMASNGLRTICIAFRDFEVDEGEKWSNPDNVEYNLTLSAIVGINDPVRPEVPAAVERCQRAGITVRMVTGDNILTAKDIARQCGIYREGSGGIAMEGKDFRKMKPEELDLILPNLQVLARSTPNDKYILVNRLRVLGEVVAVTGDGTNDAPALKEADVGFSMGISGTEVAKEASDVILMDDNFSSLVRAVVWGRSVYDNIRKFIQFQLTVNVVALVVSFVGACNPNETELPLKPVQMLWVNLIMDTMGALALSTEYPTDQLLDRKPYGRFESLLSPNMIRNISGQAFYQIIVLGVIYFAGANFFDLNVEECDHDDLDCIKEADCLEHLLAEDDNELNDCLESYAEEETTILFTILFNSFVWCQIFNEMNSRKLGNEINPYNGLFTNRLFVLIIVITATFQALIVEFGGRFTQTTSLTGAQWAACIILGFISAPIGVLIRMIRTEPIVARLKGRMDDGTSSMEMTTMRPVSRAIMTDIAIQTDPVTFLD